MYLLLKIPEKEICSAKLYNTYLPISQLVGTRITERIQLNVKCEETVYSTL